LSDTTSKRKRGVGCLLPLGLYVVSLVVIIFLTRPPEITDDFSGRTARMFSVATVSQAGNGPDYGVTSLEALQTRSPDLSPQRFLLPEENVTISAGDIHRVTVLEDHGDWQLIRFNYSNSYTATSVYRAFAGRIEPVSFRMTSSIGDGMIAIVLIVPVYLLALLITFIRNRRNVGVRDHL